ncbi:MAG: hypothetical protein ABID64_05035 [Nitrospirota bacterium]
MEKEGHLLKVTENPQEQLTMLWAMDRIYNRAKAITERFPVLKQEMVEALAAFEPTENNLPEQIEDLRPAHQALIKALENGIGKQTFSSFTSLEKLRDFDKIVKKAAQTLKEKNVETVAASSAVDIIIGEIGIDKIETRFRIYIKELVLDIIDENGSEVVDEDAEKGLFELVEKGDITEILKLLKLTDTELRARQYELGKTLVNDILEIREKVRGQYPEPIFTLEERAEQTFDDALDEAIDEETIAKGELSLDTIDRLLGELDPLEEAIIRMGGIKKIRRGARLTNSHECSTLSAEDLMTIRDIEENTREFLSQQLSTTTSEEPLPDDVTQLFPDEKL